MDEKNCIRVYADEAQIGACKKQLEARSGELDETARVFALIGNEVRSRILFLLQREERLCVCDLVDVLDMKAPAVSQHLRKLYDGGLITKERVGQTLFYDIAPAYRPVMASCFASTATERSGS